MRELTDPLLIRALSSRSGLGDWVLVTGNDGMPAEHPRVFERFNPTVATIDPRQPETVTEVEWRTDVAQRWAHAMQAQDRGTVRRYSIGGSRIWTPRPIHRRFTA
jgi:hypothetical protein